MPGLIVRAFNRINCRWGGWVSANYENIMRIKKAAATDAAA
jgi:hypothetical protein